MKIKTPNKLKAKHREYGYNLGTDFLNQGSCKMDI